MASRSPLNLTRLSWGLALPVLFLIGVGLATIHATDRDLIREQRADAELRSEGPLAAIQAAIGVNTARQVLFLITGVGLMLVALVPSYQRFGQLSFIIYAVAIVLLALLVIDRFVDLPLIPVKRNTRRWIQVGLGDFAIQPSEFMKPALILALARYLRYRSSYRKWWGLIPPFLLTLVPMLLIQFQPDLGTLLMLLPVLFSMLFVAGARLKHLLTVVVLGGATLPAFYSYGMAEYQRQRIDMVLRQSTTDEAWHRGPGYQLRQSKIALGTGGLWGVGYAQGAFIERGLLPEEHNDFIFAMVGHQFGWVGCGLVVLAYGLMVLFGIEVATATNDPFGRLLAIGVVVMIVMQAILNMCMTVGLAPITGMTLPFVSYGGSSLWANFLALGVLLNVAQRRPMLISRRPFEHEDDE
ncbi:Peptidoglycan glycosyltransferase MrdB [Phycisphaerae bacterium RAS1]|nr:Peptidoglycan glycosyltransferase MrdB [Phycisphaerae bacterium RAS1]